MEKFAGILVANILKQIAKEALHASPTETIKDGISRAEMQINLYQKIKADGVAELARRAEIAAKEAAGKSRSDSGGRGR